LYGYLVEMDPGIPPGEYLGAAVPGRGHKKLGAVGRARWENATFVVNDDWNLPVGQPLVLYAGDDRRGGRIYKFVSRDPVRTGMDRAELRELLDEGTVYVAQPDMRTLFSHGPSR